MVLPNDSIGRIFSSIEEYSALEAQPNSGDFNGIDEAVFMKLMRLMILNLMLYEGRTNQ
jgi:hypothetical protein